MLPHNPRGQKDAAVISKPTKLLLSFSHRSLTFCYSPFICLKFLCLPISWYTCPVCSCAFSLCGAAFLFFLPPFLFFFFPYKSIVLVWLLCSLQCTIFSLFFLISQHLFFPPFTTHNTEVELLYYLLTVYIFIILSFQD